MELRGVVVHEGSGLGPLLVLQRPISLWGGVNPETGRVTDPRHPHHGDDLAGRILVMERTIGSSSSSAVMLELLRNRVSPAGIVVGRPDSILVLGLLVAEELGYATVPVLQIGQRGIARLAGCGGRPAAIRDGCLTVGG